MSYNGYKNYETWNVVLWINNDEGLYNIAEGCLDYEDFRSTMLEFDSLSTPDNVAWFDSKLDISAIDEACFVIEISEAEAKALDANAPRNRPTVRSKRLPKRVL